MHRVHKTDLVLLHSRGKAHEIISHAIAEDPISKLSMTSEETVGEYLTRARTLVKLKIKNIAMWHSEFDEADAYHICNRLLKTGLKSRMLRRVSQFKTYKEFFNTIEDE